jgi:hypothetical protein
MHDPSLNYSVTVGEFHQHHAQRGSKTPSEYHFNNLPAVLRLPVGSGEVVGLSHFFRDWAAKRDCIPDWIDKLLVRRLIDPGSERLVNRKALTSD